MALINCPECGRGNVSDSAKTCPNCGFPINQKEATATDTMQTETSSQPILTQEQKNKKKIIGIIMCVIACICFVVAISNITSDEYAFYLEHYEDCMEGYENCKYKARTEGAYFSSSYERLADSYKEMCDSDMAEIWKYRGTAIACGAGGILLLVFGVKKIKEGTK